MLIQDCFICIRRRHRVQSMKHGPLMAALGSTSFNGCDPLSRNDTLSHET